MTAVGSIEWVMFTVDWLTCSYSYEQSREVVASMADRWLHEQLGLGYRCQLWEQYGYMGWSINGLRYGTREQDDIVSISSNTASLYWPRYHQYAQNVSRIDLAATVRYLEPQNDAIVEMFKTIQNDREDLHGSRAYAIIESMLGGDTLYIGKRSSANYGRVYDKSIESGTPEFENCIRFEAEIKKPYAHPVSTALFEATNRESYINSYLAEWFMLRGVEVPWTSTNCHNAIEIPRRPNDNERSLAWLERGVKPTVQRLIKEGLSVDVMIALGIELTY